MWLDAGRRGRSPSPARAVLRLRPGVTLAECVVALAVGGLTTAAVASVMLSQARVLRTVSERSADADARRITAGVLRDELRMIDPVRDIRSIAGDSVAVRLFRGGGTACGADLGALLVEYSGSRAPDASKDSALVLTSTAEAVYAVTGADAATCAAGPAQRVAIDGGPPAQALLVLVFESGTYYVRDRALRYRLGREGRQPLTDERFARSGTVAAVAPDTAGTRLLLAWDRPAPRVDSLVLPFINGRR